MEDRAPFLLPGFAFYHLHEAASLDMMKQRADKKGFLAFTNNLH
jgi:hypothetical protein